jgi:hypothetical protein
MNRRTGAISAVVLVAVIAVISVAAAFMLSPQQQPNPSTSPSTPTEQSTATSAPMSAVGPTQFSPTISISYLNIEGIPNPMSYFNTTTAVTSGSHEFSINVTNPQSSSPQQCNIEVVLTEKDKASASLNDAILGVNTMGQNQNGQPDPTYASFTPLNATVSGNQLIFTFAPAGQYVEPYIEKLSSTGFTVSIGFDESFDMMFVLASSGQYNLSVNLVPVA